MTAHNSDKTSKRDDRRKKRQHEQRASQLWWGGGIVLVVGVLALLFWYANRPLLGDNFPTTGEDDHVDDGQPIVYSTDPPTSGTHYPTWWEPGFYDETSPEATNFPFPAGYLVHNLEHGYVIFWYNCALVTPEACTTLKSNLRAVIETANNLKVIAFPWTTTDVPVVATSWGQMLKMETFDPKLAADMIQRNRNHAPENNAP